MLSGEQLFLMFKYPSHLINPMEQMESMISETGILTAGNFLNYTISGTPADSPGPRVANSGMKYSEASLQSHLICIWFVALASL